MTRSSRASTIWPIQSLLPGPDDTPTLRGAVEEELPNTMLMSAFSTGLSESLVDAPAEPPPPTGSRRIVMSDDEPKMVEPGFETFVVAGESERRMTADPPTVPSSDDPD